MPQATTTKDADILAPPVRARGTARLSRQLMPWVCLTPMLVLTAIFVLFPALIALALVFYDFDILAGTIRWVGLKNINRAIARGEVLNAIFVTLRYAIYTVIPSLTLGLLAALAINGVRRAASFWRAIYFLPVAATLVAMSIVWRWMFLARRGLIDQTVGKWLGLTDWLNSTDLSLPAVALVGNWQQIGFVTIVYLAGLAGVPKHLLEAARIDGASAWHRFWHVTWPALGPTTVFAAVISSIQALRIFDTIATMTSGGPSGSSETLTYLLWKRGIYYLDIGGGAVVTVVLLALALLATWIQKRASRRLERAGSR
ncbi:carbohydrate ABC transporter permease [Pseudooceanicola sp. 200-1SW]|uniref:carbohydrate ABC transporter permease n=1 Tax=Pseudooceanicola sp. 200-1SW TaxID=3425949 RepID=UPI003D7FD307